MIDYFIKKWDKNNVKLKEYFKNNTMDQYDNYEMLVKLTIELVINDEEPIYDSSKIHMIDDSDHEEGTLLFLIPKDTHQPYIEDYIVTSVYYGSCSGCDTLQGIHNHKTDFLPIESQINDFMKLCLNIIQEIRFLKEENES
jgi:hypothetical protein